MWHGLRERKSMPNRIKGESEAHKRQKLSRVRNCYLLKSIFTSAQFSIPPQPWWHRFLQQFVVVASTVKRNHFQNQEGFAAFLLVQGFFQQQQWEVITKGTWMEIKMWMNKTWLQWYFSEPLLEWYFLNMSNFDGIF